MTDGVETMTSVLYIDILFLVNWMMDAVILLLTGRFLRRKIWLWRVSAGAAVGGMGACVAAVLMGMERARGGMPRPDGVEILFLGGWMPVGLQLFQWIFMPAVMVRIAYPIKELRELLRGCLCLYLSAALLGGLIHAIWENTALGRFWQLWMTGSEAEAISIWLLALALAGSFVAVECGLRYRKASGRREQIQEVTLYHGGRQQTVRALWDSGNQLRDPFTGKAVHILQAEIAQDVLGDIAYRYVMEMCGAMETSSIPAADSEPAADEPPKCVEGEAQAPPISVRLIPCRSLGSAHTLLPVLSITRLHLADGQFLDAPLIGLSTVPLSGDGSYQMLLHSQTDEMRRNL